MLKTVYRPNSYTMARLSTATRQEVVILRQQGLSPAENSMQTGVVQALLKKNKESGNAEDRRRSGRPRKHTAADVSFIRLTSLRDRKMSSSAISSDLGPWYTHLLSRDVWSEVAFVEDLRTKSQATRLCTKTQELGCKKMAAGVPD